MALAIINKIMFILWENVRNFAKTNKSKLNFLKIQNCYTLKVSFDKE